MMGDETLNTMNLDLNLGPVLNPDDEPVSGVESMNLEEWLDSPGFRAREVFTRQRAARQRSGQRWGSVRRPVHNPTVTRNLALDLMVGNGLEMGEGNVTAEERPAKITKTCDAIIGCLEDGVLGKKEDVEKCNAGEGSFFDCNICLDLAREPVVTCCGHFFCWPCLYRWLNHDSDAKECPICKGEVTIKNVTPIYGRGNIKHEPNDDKSLKIPQRPQARRVESWRETIQRNAFVIPMEEMMRRLGNRFDMSQDMAQVDPQNSDNPGESPERNSSLYSRIMTSRGLRGEHNAFFPPEDAVDLSHTSPP